LVALVNAVGRAELVDVLVQQQHLGLHAERDHGSVHPRDTGPDDDHLPGVHPGDAADQNAAPATGPHQVVRAGLRGEPTGHLAHRRQERQCGVRGLHRLVGDAGHAALQERIGARPRRGEVQVGEEHLTVTHPVVLRLDRLLDLEHQLAGLPHLVGRP